MLRCLFADYNLPFAIALGAVLVLALLQFVSVGDIDFGPDADLEVDLDAAPHDVSLGGSITTLLGLGRVPFLVWLMVFLLVFASLGLGIQELADRLTGAPLYAWLAAVLSFGASLPVTAALVRPVARIMPRDESDAVGLDSLVGRRAQVITGHARNGDGADADDGEAPEADTEAQKG